MTLSINPLFRLCLIAALLAMPPALRAEIRLEASPEGPVNSLASARDAVRQARREHPGQAIRVVFTPGVYRIADVVAFGAEDSGRESAPVTYEALNPGSVTFHGGKTIAMKARPDGLWEADLPGAAKAKAKGGFEQLWVNGRRAIRARSPNAGFMPLYSQASTEVFPDMTAAAFQGVTLRADDYALVKAIPEEELPDVLMTVCHAWTVGQCRIAARNDAARAVRVAGKMRYPFIEFEPDQRFFLENYAAALDAPGEWFLQPDGKLLYKPAPGETPEKTIVTSPGAAEQFILAEGLREVSFRGLGFAYSQQIIGPQGHHDGQAAAEIGAVIELRNCRHVSFHQCEVAHTGRAAFWFRQGSQDCSLTDSLARDLGAGGVRIGDTSGSSMAEEKLTRRIAVDNCILQSGGRIYPSACGVFLAHAADCAVTHCDIGDFYYTGISAGWVWGYAHSPSKRNRFDYNHIHHLGWGYLSDMGGFYGLGRSEGTTVSHNYVHHVASYRYGGWGLYTDEGSTGVTLENNLVHDTSEGTFHQHYGKWNRVSNNILAFGGKAQIQRTRPEPHASFEYDRNIVLYETPRLLDGSWHNWEKGTMEMRSNLYWNTAGLPVKFLDLDLAAWQAKTGREEGSIIADPLFENAAARDFRLKPGSPAEKIGFIPFDFTQAGVRGEAWRKKAAELEFSDFQERSKPWPQPQFSLGEDFESMSLGIPTLTRQEVSWDNKGDAIRVTEAAARSGRRSLEFVDAPGLSKPWIPNLALNPGYQAGTVEGTISFSPGSPRCKMDCEWRTEGHPYQTGPSLSWRDGKLRISQGPSFPLAAGEWAHAKITATLGAGKWTLVLTLPGKEPQTFPDLPCSPGWTNFGWLGIVSAADEAATFYVDDLSLRLIEPAAPGPPQ